MSLNKKNFELLIIIIIISLNQITSYPYSHRPPPKKPPSYIPDDNLDYLYPYHEEYDNERKFAQIDINNKLKIINELKEKTKDISRKNDASKNELQKYLFYYQIMVILNIIFAFILLFFLFYKIYYYYKLLKKSLNDINMMIDISKNNYFNSQENIRKKETNIDIIKTSFEIKGGNDKPVLIIESFDKSEAPTVNNC